jgi:hypothetical protein
VRGTDQQVQVEGPVLAVLEAAEAVKYEGLARSLAGTVGFEEEQAVAPQAFALALNTAVADRELAGDLAQGRTAEQALEEGPQQARLLEPVGRGEGL